MDGCRRLERTTSIGDGSKCHFKVMYDRLYDCSKMITRRIWIDHSLCGRWRTILDRLQCHSGSMSTFFHAFNTILESSMACTSVFLTSQVAGQ